MAKLFLLILISAFFLAKPLMAQEKETVEADAGNSDAEGELKDPEIQFVPAAPKRLISILPPAPRGWRLTRSEGGHYFSGVLYSRSVREYTEILSPKLVGKVEPLRVVVEVRDSCRNPLLLQPFKLKREDLDEFKSDLKLGYWKENPAILVNHGDGKRDSVRVLLGQRFIVQVLYYGKDYKATKPWLEKLDIAGMQSIQLYAFSRPPESFKMQRVDQLDPKKSRTYVMKLTKVNDPNNDFEKGETLEGRGGLKPPFSFTSPR